MNVHFTSTHINTICELNELAKKHGCRLYISAGNHRNSNSDAVNEIFEFLRDANDHENDLELTDDMIEELIDYYDFENAYFSADNVCFELLEGNKSHSLTYFLYEMGFYTDVNPYDKWQELSKEAEDWAFENFDSSYFYKETDKTIIRGFEGVDTTKVNVYREGMALKFFGDLVCDYLKEPRIEKVY